MWQSFLKWLATFPSPWDAITALAAGGALTISLLERRDRRRSDDPMFEGEITHREGAKLWARITVTNQAPYDLQGVALEVLRPRGAKVIKQIVSTQSGGWTWDWDKAAPITPINIRVKRAGTEPAYSRMGGMMLAHGDRAPVEFGILLPAECAETTVELRWRPALVAARERRIKIAMEIPPAETSQ